MGYTEEEKNYIRYVLSDRPHLIPIFESALDIPNRVHEYDNEAFIVYDNIRKVYELHSLYSFRLEQEGWSTRQFRILFDELDERLLDYMKGNDFNLHGFNVLQQARDGSKMKERDSEFKSDLLIEQSIREVMKFDSGRNWSR